ncbi:MAG TPA: site-2 protease family protein [Gammaproteobacteria bacterium]
MLELSLAQKIAVWVLPVLLAITVHEVSHGWVARHFGDQTASLLGRLSLNPLRHIDPVGTVLVPGLMLFLTGFVFGWAKPVPVDARNLRRPRRDMAWVAAAGPFANLCMALGWALLAQLGGAIGGWAGQPLVLMAVAGIFINTILMVLNLLPLPPLDGGRVAVGVLPEHLARPLARIEPYGIWILLALLFTGLLGGILWPIVVRVIAAFVSLTGLSTQAFEHILRVLLGG